MMTPATPDIENEAVLWALRTRAPDFTAWEEFTDWLEADPRHNIAYDRVRDAHDLAADLPPVTVATEEPAPRRFWRFRLATAVAAGLAAVIGMTTLLPGNDPYAVSTGPGEQRDIRLADGTRIALNGDTRLLLDHAHPRVATLDRGQAGFTVMHDATNPFVLTVGGTAVQDVGTRFDVVREGGRTDVAVAEGAVLYDPGGSRVSLQAGSTLTDPGGGAPLRLGRADPATIGTWRGGRLVYGEVPLATVAADLARVTGTPITVDGGLAARPFSGTIAYRGLPVDVLYRRVAALAGLRATPDGTGWRFTTGSGVAR